MRLQYAAINPVLNPYEALSFHRESLIQHFGILWVQFSCLGFDRDTTLPAMLPCILASKVMLSGSPEATGAQGINQGKQLCWINYLALSCLGGAIGCYLLYQHPRKLYWQCKCIKYLSLMHHTYKPVQITVPLTTSQHRLT